MLAYLQPRNPKEESSHLELRPSHQHSPTQLRHLGHSPPIWLTANCSKTCLQQVQKVRSNIRMIHVHAGVNKHCHLDLKDSTSFLSHTIVPPLQTRLITSSSEAPGRPRTSLRKHRYTSLSSEDSYAAPPHTWDARTHFIHLAMRPANESETTNTGMGHTSRWTILLSSTATVARLHRTYRIEVRMSLPHHVSHRTHHHTHDDQFRSSSCTTLSLSGTTRLFQRHPTNPTGSPDALYQFKPHMQPNTTQTYHSFPGSQPVLMVIPQQLVQEIYCLHIGTQTRHQL